MSSSHISRTGQRRQFSSHALAIDLLATAGHIRCLATGRSMLPFLPGGSTVDIRRCGGHEIEVGDIVAVRVGPERLLMHRVVRIMQMEDGRHFLVRGDWRPEPDGWFGETEILGRVESVQLPGPAGRMAGDLRGISLDWYNLAAGRISRPLHRLYGAMVGRVRRWRRKLLPAAGRRW